MWTPEIIVRLEEARAGTPFCRSKKITQIEDPESNQGEKTIN